MFSLIIYISLCHSLCCWMEGRNDAYCYNKFGDSDSSSKKTV